MDVSSCCFPTFSQQEEANGLLTLVKREKVEGDDCNLDLKVEVNIHSECGLSAGECVSRTGLRPWFSIKKLAGHLRRSARFPFVSVNPGLEPSEETPPSDILLDAGVSSISQASSSSSPPPTDATVDLACLPRAKRKSSKPSGPPLQVLIPEVPARDLTDGGDLKPDIQLDHPLEEEELLTSRLSAHVATDEPGPCPDRLAGLGLDLAWMQERVGHLGAAYAVAQLGLASGEAAQPSASFPAQAGGEALDSPPTLHFTGAAHEMAAFAASFDIAAAAAVAVPPPPPAALPPATAAAQRRPYRINGSSAPKDPAVCAVCGRVFPSAATLDLHQRVHTGERPYTCSHCGKGFAQPNNLRVHLLIHTGERRYRCSLCGKSFISSSHLKRHRTVHTQEKPYSCSRCGQSFSQMCSVRRHRQQSQCGL